MFTKRLRPFLFMAGALFLLTACNFPGSYNSTHAQPRPDLYRSGTNAYCARDSGGARDSNRHCPARPRAERLQAHLAGGHPANQYEPATDEYGYPNQYTTTNQYAHSPDCNTHPHPLRPGTIC